MIEPIVDPAELSVDHKTGTVPSSGEESKMSELLEAVADAVPMVREMPVPESLGFFQM